MLPVLTANSGVPRAQTRSLLRGLRALQHVASRGESSVADVAGALGLPRASAHILLSTLARAGYVSQPKRRGAYRLDLQVVPLAHAVLQRMPVRERAAPLLHALASSTGQATYLAVLFRGEAMNIDRIHPRASSVARADIGQTNPAYASAMGKVLLAHLPAPELEAYLASVILEPLTERTVRSITELRRDLEWVRQQGYALSEGELKPHVRSIAAPIFSYGGAAVASICALHDTPFGRPPPDSLAPAVVDTAAQISHSLGHGAKPD